jgi:hypothetical protein
MNRDTKVEMQTDRLRYPQQLWRNLVPRYNTNSAMTEQKKTRRQLLEEFVAKEPNDAFTRYGLALECANSGDTASADLNFRELLQRNIEYVPGYLMYAQFLAKQSRIEEARAVLNTGITVAARKGDAHARSEMESLFAELS